MNDQDHRRPGIAAEAFLDVSEPEPPPADDPLWTLDNAHVTMHRYHIGQPLLPLVDLDRGY